MRFAVLALLALSPIAYAKKPKPALAPPPAADVILPCNYPAGAIHRYRIETTTTETAADGAEDVATYRTDYTFTAEGMEGPHVTALAAVGLTEVVDPPGDPIMASLMRQMAGMKHSTPARLGFDHAVGRVQVLNPEALAQDFAVTAAAIRPILEKELSHLPPDALAGLQGWVEAQASNAAVVAQPFVEVGQPVFAYTCLTVTPGSYDYPAQLPNLFGTEPFPGKGTLLVGAAQGDRVHFVDAVLLDPVGAMGILAPILAGMGIELPPDATLADLSIDISTRLDIDVSLTDGWPIGWTAEQRVVAEGMRKITRTVVTRIE